MRLIKMAIHFYGNDIQKVINTLSEDNRELILDVAIKLYTNGVYTASSPKDFAKQCLFNSVQFVAAYNEFLGKLNKNIKK